MTDNKSYCEHGYKGDCCCNCKYQLCGFHQLFHLLPQHTYNLSSPKYRLLGNHGDIWRNGVSSLAKSESGMHKVEQPEPAGLQIKTGTWPLILGNA